MLEKSKDVVILQEVEAEAVTLLLDYIYSGTVVITEENVQARRLLLLYNLIEGY